ncbi:hypothetical protein BD410DRAFT_826635 [Rickenella mellea]|uniref:Uncharacterized protein n=1 Tax=Rickenella mellea TaxID=50990 RepID=A0A4Y7QEU3_9AGAM|nr:hypothetical protein BD410DRAFT_826635 [Rickenella mellea]
MGSIASVRNFSPRHILETWTKHEYSRGDLVSSFLSGEDDQEQFFDHLAHSSRLHHPGFNLLLFTPSSSPSSSSPLKYGSKLVANLGGGGPLATRRLSSGERMVCGVSNGVDGLFGNTWCKVNKRKEILARLLADNEERSTDEAVSPFHLDPNLLPEADARECYYFGTRLSTVIPVQRDGDVVFVERDIWRLGCCGEPVRAERDVNGYFGSVWTYHLQYHELELLAQYFLLDNMKG